MFAYCCSPCVVLQPLQACVDLRFLVFFFSSLFFRFCPLCPRTSPALQTTQTHLHAQSKQRKENEEGNDDTSQQKTWPGRGETEDHCCCVCACLCACVLLCAGCSSISSRHRVGRGGQAGAPLPSGHLRDTVFTRSSFEWGRGEASLCVRRGRGVKRRAARRRTVRSRGVCAHTCQRSGSLCPPSCTSRLSLSLTLSWQHHDPSARAVPLLSPFSSFPPLLPPPRGLSEASRLQPRLLRRASTPGKERKRAAALSHVLTASTYPGFPAVASHLLLLPHLTPCGASTHHLAAPFNSPYLRRTPSAACPHTHTHTHARPATALF